MSSRAAKTYSARVKAKFVVVTVVFFASICLVFWFLVGLCTGSRLPVLPAGTSGTRVENHVRKPVRVANVRILCGFGRKHMQIEMARESAV